MTWRNVHDLGDVDLYWIDGTGALRALGELPAGTIAVVDGAIQVRDVPETSFIGDPDGCIGVAAVPAYETDGLEARGSIVAPAIDFGGFTQAEADFWVKDGAGIVNEVDLTPNFVGDVITSFTPQTEVALGAMQGEPGNAALSFEVRLLFG